MTLKYRFASILVAFLVAPIPSYSESEKEHLQHVPGAAIKILMQSSARAAGVERLERYLNNEYRHRRIKVDVQFDDVGERLRVNLHEQIPDRYSATDVEAVCAVMVDEARALAWVFDGEVSFISNSFFSGVFLSSSATPSRAEIRLAIDLDHLIDITYSPYYEGQQLGRCKAPLMGGAAPVVE